MSLENSILFCTAGSRYDAPTKWYDKTVETGMKKLLKMLGKLESENYSTGLL